MTEPHTSLVDVAGLLMAAPEIRGAFLQQLPARGSPAARELQFVRRDVGTDLPVARAVVSADVWTMIAGDLLFDIGVLVRDGRGLVGLFPLLRATIEHSVAVVWLLEPAASTRARAARAALMTERAQVESAKAAKRLAGSAHEIYVTQARARDALRAQIKQEFGVAIEGAALEGERLLTPTELAEHFGKHWGDPREWMGIYDYLCGTATHPSFNILEFADHRLTAGGQDMRRSFTLSNGPPESFGPPSPESPEALSVGQLKTPYRRVAVSGSPGSSRRWTHERAARADPAMAAQRVQPTA